jgi:hypothetical protein
MVKMYTKSDPNPALNRQALDADADADPDPTGSVYLSGPTTLQKCVAYNFRSSFFFISCENTVNTVGLLLAKPSIVAIVLAVILPKGKRQRVPI